MLPFVCISHNLKNHVTDIHKCRKVSKLFFELFLGVQDSLNRPSAILFSFVYMFLHTQRQLFVGVACLKMISIRGPRATSENLILVGSKLIALERNREGIIVFFGQQYSSNYLFFKEFIKKPHIQVKPSSANFQ